jgi:hypothetical protein
MKSILNKSLLSNHSVDFLLDKIQICSNCSIANIYTSDEFYNLNDLPKELNFRLKKGENFEDLYKFIYIDEIGVKSLIDSNGAKRNDDNNKENNADNYKTIKSTSENVERKINKDRRLSDSMVHNGTKKKGILKNTKKGSFTDLEQQSKGLDEDLSLLQPLKPREPEAIPYLRNDPYSFKEGEETLKPNMNYILDPTPIMKLKYIQGYSGKMCKNYI